MKRSRLIGIGVCALVVALSGPVPARADHEDGLYSIRAVSQWDRVVFDVLIIPPNHGQIYNFETSVLDGRNPNELTPMNSYLPAMEAAVAAWDDAVSLFGSDRLKDSFVTNVYVVGRDPIPPEALNDPEIVLVTDEDHSASLGTSVRAPVCVSRMSKLFIISFTYADMYNVTMHEYGHCLGVGHIGDQGGVDPLAEQKHPEHDAMNGFYADSVGYAGTHLHCISNLDVWGLEWVLRNPHPGLSGLAVGNRGGTVEMQVPYYGTTCEPPAVEPPPYPEPDPPPPPPPPKTLYERDIGLVLRGHLKAIGDVFVYPDQSLCAAAVDVTVVRKVGDEWVAVATDVTNAQGRFRVGLPDRKGRYRAQVDRYELDDDEVCRAGTSPSIRHRH